ncbi:MAG: hypothetical protein J7L43_02030 [Candidatus Aenigmarchaeota archaeon]|nr:hypothetical protein [Candidatus Aenigmarchaeota archaeon]
MKRSKRLRDIYKHFGDKTQREKLSEECMEYVESGEDEEIADLYILASQLFLTSEKIRELVEYKIGRTETRIGMGYYKEKTV